MTVAVFSPCLCPRLRPVLCRGGGLATRGQPRQGQYRSVWWPPPALSDNSDCVLAESAEAGRVPLTEEAAIQSEASSVPEWGAGHCHGTEEGVGDALSDAPGPRDAPGDAPGDTPGE